MPVLSLINKKLLLCTLANLILTLLSYGNEGGRRGSGHEVSYSSARTHDSNEISKATSTFLEPSNSMELFPILSKVIGSLKSKMAAIKPEVHESQHVDMIEAK